MQGKEKVFCFRASPKTKHIPPILRILFRRYSKNNIPTPFGKLPTFQKIFKKKTGMLFFE
jgi:hypothetical protein